MRGLRIAIVIALQLAMVRVGHADKASKEAADALQSGRELMKEKKYARACEAFADSQNLDPQTSTQLALAACYVELGKLGSAWRIYHDLGKTDAKAADKATKLAARAGSITLTLKPKPEGLRVFANSSDASSAIGEPMPVDTGRVDLAATAPGFETWRKTIEVESGQEATVNVKLVRNTTVAKLDPNNPDEPDPESAQDQPDRPTGVRTMPLEHQLRGAVDLGFLFKPQAYRATLRLAYSFGGWFDAGVSAGARGGDLAKEYGGGVDARVFLPFGSFCRAYGHIGAAYWTTTHQATDVGGGLACQDWLSNSGPQVYVGFDKEIGDGPGGGVMVGVSTTLMGKR